MIIRVFETRADEKEILQRTAAELGIEILTTDQIPNRENAELVCGCEGVSFLGQGRIDKELLDLYHSYGVKYLSTRTIGTNHIDVEYARKLGIRVCNATYAPNGVADFTVMLMLMCLRHYKQAMWRGQVNDFALFGLQGRELRDMTVGIVGGGRIGQQVARNLSGFGCRILICDRHPREEIAAIAEYTDMETLYAQSDIITLHVPLRDNNYHMINEETISKMKDGVILINCSRGELADNEALVRGIENCKIGALGMDTAEGEEGIIHGDHRVDILSNRNWFYLHQFRNVIMTQHMAFYTQEAVESMARCGLEGIYQMNYGMPCENEVLSA